MSAIYTDTAHPVHGVKAKITIDETSLYGEFFWQFIFYLCRQNVD